MPSLTEAILPDVQPVSSQYEYTPENSTVSNYTSQPAGVIGVDDYLWIYMAPVLFVVGVVGNVLIVAVMRRGRLANTSTSVYLRCMGIIVIGVFLTGILPQWLRACSFVDIRELNPWSCCWNYFIYYALSDVATWVLVAFTVDRFIAVCYPLHKSAVCRPQRAKVICVVLCCLAVAKNLHIFWTRGAEYTAAGVSRKNCGRPAAYADFELYIRPWIVFVMVVALPFLTLIVANFCIIHALRHTKHVRRNSISPINTPFHQTAAMCLSASFVFLVCVAPSIVLVIGRVYWANTDVQNNSYNIAKAVNNQLVYVNYAANFFLYCLIGKRFRDELVAMFRCHKHSPTPISLRAAFTYRTTSTMTSNTKLSQIPMNGASVCMNGAISACVGAVQLGIGGPVRVPALSGHVTPDRRSSSTESSV